MHQGFAPKRTPIVELRTAFGLLVPGASVYYFGIRDLLSDMERQKVHYVSVPAREALG